MHLKVKIDFWFDMFVPKSYNDPIKACFSKEKCVVSIETRKTQFENK